MESKKENISSLGLGIRVKTLVNLRWIAVLGQTITCFIVHYFLNFDLPAGNKTQIFDFTNDLILKDS